MKVTLVSFFILLFFLLTGCSDGGEAISVAQDTENSFPPQQEDPFEPPSDEDSQPSPEPNEIFVEVQATDAMLASWDRTLFRWLTPAQAMAFRGLSPVKVRDLSVMQVSRNLTSSAAPNVQLDYTTQENGDGTYSLLFNSALDIPAQIDVLVRAQLDNGTVLWAPLVNDGGVIKVNIVSTYLVEQLVDEMRAQNITMNDLRPCGAQFGCENQHEARLLIWFGVLDSVQTFDITIPDNQSASQVKTFLSQQTTFQQFVDAGITNVLDEGYIGAISQPLDFTNLLETTTSLYHSVFFSMGLSEREPDQSSTGSLLFNRVSTTATSILNDGSTEFIYPSLTETKLRTTVTTHSLFGDLPYTRLSLSQPDASSFILNENQTTEVNTFSAAPSSSYVNTDGFLSFAQTPYQSITGKSTPNIRGWLTNPFYVSLYGDESRSFLASASTSTGRVYDLSAVGDNQFQRNRVVENTNEFNFEMSLPANVEELSLVGATGGKNYGVIQLTQSLSDSASAAVTVTGQTAFWQINSELVSEGAEPDDDTGFYTKVTLERDRQQMSSGATQTNTPSLTYTLSDLPSTVYDSEIREQVEKNIGRVTLQRSGLDFAAGVAAPTGERITLAIESGSQRGLIDAVEISSDISTLSGETYQLQGHSFGMTSTENRLISYNGSSLAITSDGEAILTLVRNVARQNTTTMKVTAVAPMAELSESPRAGIAVTAGKVIADFGDVAGEPLSIKGFVSQGRSSLHLIIQHGNAVGLLWGFQQLNLPKS